MLCVLCVKQKLCSLYYNCHLGEKSIFSCEDAAQQVLMSVCLSVCLCVCVSVCLSVCGHSSTFSFYSCPSEMGNYHVIGPVCLCVNTLAQQFPKEELDT